MTDKEKIRNIIELFIAWNGETDVIDVANIDSAIEFIANSLQEEPVSKELEQAAEEWDESLYRSDAFKAGAKWQKEKDDEEKVLTYKHGFGDCKKQMMTKAIDGKVIANGMGNPILHL